MAESEKNPVIKGFLRFCILFLVCYVISVLSTASEFFILRKMNFTDVSYTDKITVYSLIEIIVMCIVSLSALYVLFKKSFHIIPNFVFNIIEIILIVVTVFLVFLDLNSEVSNIIPAYFPYRSFDIIQQKASYSAVYIFIGGKTIKSIIQLFSFSLLFYMFFFKDQKYVRKNV